MASCSGAPTHILRSMWLMASGRCKRACGTRRVWSSLASTWLWSAPLPMVAEAAGVSSISATPSQRARLAASSLCNRCARARSQSAWNSITSSRQRSPRCSGCQRCRSAPPAVETAGTWRRASWCARPGSRGRCAEAALRAAHGVSSSAKSRHSARANTRTTIGAKARPAAAEPARSVRSRSWNTRSLRWSRSSVWRTSCRRPVALIPPTGRLAVLCCKLSRTM
mmetsp:Transcript_127964/g.368688  ORF Transcript_127964/g.368688 Transcript_127964/m.368688 type:complete len:224 (+) Transcript_127964:470-1141(+)